MLEKFKVSNFRSFNHPLEIDFTNVHDYKFSQSALSDGLVGKLLVYGANASGKSNLGFALFDIVATLTDKNIGPLNNNIGFYLNGDCDQPVARFEYHFRFNNDLIIYCYEKSSLYELQKESLTLNGIELFDYSFVSKTGQFKKNRREFSVTCIRDESH